MAELRISRVTAQSNAPSSLRIAGVRVLSGTAAPDARLRIAGVRALNQPQGAAWVMQGGVWKSAPVYVHIAGAWVRV